MPKCVVKKCKNCALKVRKKDGVSYFQIKSERINALKKRYDAFLEEDKKRKERNEYIIERLDKIRCCTAMIQVRQKQTVNEDCIHQCNYNPIHTSQDITVAPPHISQKDDSILLQEISKKFILIPKLKQFSQNDPNEVMNQRNYMSNDWRSKYDILEELKKNEKEGLPAMSAKYSLIPEKEENASKENDHDAGFKYDDEHLLEYQNVVSHDEQTHGKDFNEKHINSKKETAKVSKKEISDETKDIDTVNTEDDYTISETNYENYIHPATVPQEDKVNQPTHDLLTNNANFTQNDNSINNNQNYNNETNQEYAVELVDHNKHTLDATHQQVLNPNVHKIEAANNYTISETNYENCTPPTTVLQEDEVNQPIFELPKNNADLTQNDNTFNNNENYSNVTNQEYMAESADHNNYISESTRQQESIPNNDTQIENSDQLYEENAIEPSYGNGVLIDSVESTKINENNSIVTTTELTEVEGGTAQDIVNNEPYYNEQDNTYAYSENVAENYIENPDMNAGYQQEQYAGYYVDQNQQELIAESTNKENELQQYDQNYQQEYNTTYNEQAYPEQDYEQQYEEQEYPNQNYTNTQENLDQDQEKVNQYENPEMSYPYVEQTIHNNNKEAYIEKQNEEVEINSSEQGA